MDKKRVSGPSTQPRSTQTHSDGVLQHDHAARLVLIFDAHDAEELVMVIVCEHLKRELVSLVVNIKPIFQVLQVLRCASA